MNNFDDDDDYGYYGGGCFHGDCKVQLHDGSIKYVKDLKKTDNIATPGGQGAKIICVVKTKTWNGSTRMCELEGGLMVTPGHPIKNQAGSWVYPRTLADPKSIACDYFYNLVVDREHVAKIERYELILLGHNYTEGILKHEYLGSQRVIKDLIKVQTFKNGI